MEIAIFLQLLIQALSFVVIVDAVSSWVVPNPSAFPRSITGAIAGPLCAPFRKLIPPERVGGLDVSPLLVILSLNLVASGVAKAAMGI
ncbi:MAG: YggT family protein [Myxococcota bacterium]